MNEINLKYLGFLMTARALVVVTDSTMKKDLAILFRSQWAFSGSPLMAAWAASESSL